MSKIDELIEELCPDGVVWRKLSELGEVISGLKGKSKEDFTDGNAPYVSYIDISYNPGLSQNITNLVKISDQEKQNEIKLGDVLVTGSSETKNEVGLTSVVIVEPKQKTYLNSFCFIWRPNSDLELNPNFTKHYFRSKEFRDKVVASANGVTRQNLSKPKFLSIEIPLPPIKIQNEIASILDKFTELEAELESRKKQFEYYRESLFSNKDFEVKMIDDIATIWRGRRFVKDDIQPSGVPAIHYGEIYTKYGLSATTTYSFLDSELASKLRFVKTGDVVLVSAGETIQDIGKSFAWLGNQDAVIHDACYGLRSSSVIPKYMVHFFNTHRFRSQLRKYISTSKVSAISPEKLGKVLIPVPAIDHQRELAALLDGFDSLIFSISSGLPAEIEARRKQYEYYRNKLLTFKELKSA